MGLLEKALLHTAPYIDPSTAGCQGLGPLFLWGEGKREFVFNQVSLLRGLSNEDNEY